MDTKLEKISKYTDKEFKKYLATEDLDRLYELKDYADDLYYNADLKSSPLNDDQYDMLKDAIIERNPEYKPTVGAQLRKGENRVELPFWLGSMNKFKPGNKDKLERWLSKNKSSEYVIEDKLDGVSCLLIMDGMDISLYTRGDGIIGADISYLAPYFKNIPKNNVSKKISVRGELIIPVEVFDKKYSEEYANPRNMVSGLINAKTIRDGLQFIDFVAYEIVGETLMPKPTEQLRELSRLGFQTVRYEILMKITEESLISILAKFKGNTPYEIDGIIVQGNKNYVRNTDGNPDYAFAFKVQAVAVETVVTEVLWNVSKWGLLKPRIEIEPVKLGGVTVRYVTGFNAKYIDENNIGPGAVIAIIRSGDVIPHIVDIISEAEEPQMPDISYKWNKSSVDIVMEDFGTDMCIKLIAGFFNKLGIKQIGESRVKQLYDDGLDTLLKIIAASEERLEAVPGFQKKGAEKIHNNIETRLQKVSVPMILGSSGIFGMGMGRKRITALFSAMPNILTEYKKMSRKELYTRVLEIDGFSDITTLSIVDNIEWADKFIKALNKYIKVDNKPANVKKTMEGWTIVFTQVRNAELQEQIEARGGKVVESAPSKNTTMVVVPSNYDRDMNKVKKAIQLGKPIIKIEDFIKKYINK